MKFEDKATLALARLIGNSDFVAVRGELENQATLLTKELLSVDASDTGKIGRLQGNVEIINELVGKIDSARITAEKIAKSGK